MKRCVCRKMEKKKAKKEGGTNVEYDDNVQARGRSVEEPIASFGLSTKHKRLRCRFCLDRLGVSIGEKTRIFVHCALCIGYCALCIGYWALGCL